MLAILEPILQPFFQALLPFIWSLISAPNTMEDSKTDDALDERLRAAIRAQRLPR